MRRRFTLLCAMAAVVFSASATDVKTHRLTRMYSESGNDNFNYFYDDQNRIDSIRSLVLTDYVLDCASKIVYNDAGEQIAEEGYQKLNGSENFTHTIHIDYTWENGKLASRANYNNFGSGFNLGGLYVYEYDDQGRLSKSTLYTGLDKTEIWTYINYYYDEQGRLSKEETYGAGWGTSDFSFFDGAVYLYDDQGRLTGRDYLIDSDGTTQGGERIEYDADGNVLKTISFSSSPQSPTGKETYEFDTSITVAETSLPISIEEKDQVSQLSKNVKSKRYYYALDLNSGNLVLYDIFNYVYEKGGSSSIRNTMRGELIGMSLTGGSLVLDKSGAAQTVRVFTADGRLVMSVRSNGQTVDISSLPAGTYVAQAGSSTLKFHKK